MIRAQSAPDRHSGLHPLELVDTNLILFIVTFQRDDCIASNLGTRTLAQYRRLIGFTMLAKQQPCDPDEVLFRGYPSEIWYKAAPHP